MPKQEVQEQIEKGELIISVDDTRAANDPHKLQTYTRTLVVERLADLRVKEAATYSTAGGRAGASAQIRVALDELQTLHTEGYHRIEGLLRSEISPGPARIGRRARQSSAFHVSPLNLLA